MARFNKAKVVSTALSTGLVPVFYNACPEISKAVLKACYDGGIVTEAVAGMGSAAELVRATGDAVVLISTVSMYCFLVARSVLAIGESGNFPAAIKTTAEYFPKKDRAFATSIFNAGASIGALIAPLTIPLLAKAYGWEMAFIIGVLGFIWMGVWVFVYDKPENSKYVNAAELEYIRQAIS